MSRQFARIPEKEIKDQQGLEKNRREKHFRKQYTLINPKMESLVIVRMYCTEQYFFACAWVNDPKHGMFHNGGGRGINEAAAVYAALESAGIFLKKQPKGNEIEYIIDAMEAIAETLGYKKVKVLIAHP